ncbi:uncharacterized protein BDV17DRAFT_295272 [Aspergillus undulatus]|uniref:uncharacterized protein n=1 Tax=Aspergillus undulatus TaxID=1810928 RepID=UPI003CCD1076
MADNQTNSQTTGQPDSGPGIESAHPEPRTESIPEGLFDDIDLEQYIAQDVDTSSASRPDTESVTPDASELQLELALTTLKAKDKLSDMRLPSDSTLGDVPVHTFGDLLVELKAKYKVLSRADYLDYFKHAHWITAATFGPMVEQSMQALVGLEDLGRAYIAGFKEYSETDEYQERFPEYKEARDWVKHNKKSSEAAKQQVPTRYQHYGSALLTCYNSQHWHRALKTLTNKFYKEEDGIGALNRAILNRVKKSKTSKHGRKGQKAIISVSTADLGNALRLAGQHWSIPSPEEIEAENLFIDRVLGTLTSVPEHSQSYAETVASESPAPTPRQPSHHVSLVSRPSPLELQHTPSSPPAEAPPGQYVRRETPALTTPIAALDISPSSAQQNVPFTSINQSIPSGLQQPSVPHSVTTNTNNQREPSTSNMAEQTPALSISGHGAQDETPVPERRTNVDWNSTPDSPTPAPSTSGHGARDGTPVPERRTNVDWNSTPDSPTPAPSTSGHGARDGTPVPERRTNVDRNSTPDSPTPAPSTSGHGARDGTPVPVSSNTTSEQKGCADEAPTAGSEAGVTDEEILGEEDLPAEEGPCVCLTSTIFDQAILSQIEAEANKRRPLGWTPERARQARVNFLGKLAKPLAEAEQDNSRICSRHLNEIRKATGLSAWVKDPELIHRLAVLSSNCDSLESWDKYVHRDAQRSLWFSAPVFEHNLFSQFHYHFTGIPLKMPESNGGWDFLIDDLMKHVPSLTDDPRSLLASKGYVDIKFTNPYLQTPEMQHLLALETRIIDHHTAATGGMRWARQHSVAQQIAVQDIGRYYIDVLLRPDHPHDLIAYPQPAIDTRTSDKDEAPAPFHVPLSMHRPFKFKNSLTSFIPLLAEDKQGCDHFLHGAGGTIEAFDDFCEVYAEYLDGCGGVLPFRFEHSIDAEGLARTRPEAFSIYPTPLPSTSHVRFMVPWMPRASRGNGPRLVLQPTLVAPRDAHPTDEDYTESTACDTRVDGGVHFEDVQDYNTQMTASKVGPWGACHPSRKLRSWPAWQSVHGVNALSDAITGRRDHHGLEVIIVKNILFNTDPTKAKQRWELIDQFHQAAADAAKRAIHDFIQAEAALFPETGFCSGSPRPRPDEQWVTITDKVAIQEFIMPQVDDILNENGDPDWIPSEDERVSEEGSESETEDKAHDVFSDIEEASQRRHKHTTPAPQNPRAVKKPKTVAFSSDDTYTFEKFVKRWMLLMQKEALDHVLANSQPLEEEEIHRDLA